MQDSVLEIDRLCKCFGNVRAVDEVSLSVQRGEIFGFLGPNGAGKTTTISMILGLLHPTSGSVRVFGEPVLPSANRPLRRIGALVGAPGLVPNLSGRANLRLLARLHSGVDNPRVEQVLELTGIAHAGDRKVKGYSTGMKQRLGLAAAILHRPELLILDEPTNGLDPAGMREVREFLKQMTSDGVTVFISSHLLHEIEQLCDRVAVLNRGKLISVGEVGQLSGGKVVVRAKVPSPADAALLLQSLPGIDSIKTNGTYVEVSGVSSEAVIVHLVNGGIVPSEVTLDHADLESVFLELTEAVA